MFTTWEEWLDVPHIPLSTAAALLVCGPKFPDCELTRAGICAVTNRDLPVLERWKNLQEYGLCQGIEYARKVARIQGFMGLNPLQMWREVISLRDFATWAQTKIILSLLQNDSNK